MKRICSWCGRELGQATRPEERRVTHGVCGDCRVTHFPPAKEKLASLPGPADEGRDDGRSEHRDPSE
jgi:hypothetical protein